MNRTLAFPSPAINTMIYNPDPLETNDQGSQIGPQDPNFMHSFAWLDLTGRTARQHLVDVYNRHTLAMQQIRTHYQAANVWESWLKDLCACMQPGRRCSVYRTWAGGSTRCIL